MARDLDLTRGKTSRNRGFALVILLLLAASIECPYAEDKGKRMSVLTCGEENSLRLQGTNVKNAGHLEVCHNGTWGMICGNHWKQNEAIVACRQLGYPQSRALPPEILREWNQSGNYSKGDGPRKEWFDHVYCTGQEKRLIDCQFDKDKGVLTVAYRFDIKACFQDLKLVGVECFGRTNGLLHTATVPPHSSAATTTDRAAEWTSSNRTLDSTLNLKGADKEALTTIGRTASTSAFDNRASTIGATSMNSTTNETGKSSSTFLVPFVIVAVISLFLILYIVRMVSLAMELHKYSNQLQKRLATIEARKNDMIF